MEKDKSFSVPLCDLCDSVVNLAQVELTTETQRLHRGAERFLQSRHKNETT